MYVDVAADNGFLSWQRMTAAIIWVLICPMLPTLLLHTYSENLLQVSFLK